jgi:hypothetical protein
VTKLYHVQFTDLRSQQDVEWWVPDHLLTPLIEILEGNGFNNLLVKLESS